VQVSVVFDSRYLAGSTRQMSKNGSVVPDTGTDMNHVLALSRRGVCHQPSMQRGLAVVDLPLGDDTD
jgi:hypothetical protein